MDQQENKTILFLSKGEQSPSTRYRALNYFPLLKQSGWNPSHITFTSGGTLLERWNILRHAKQADVVVIVRRTVSGLFFWLLRRLSQRLVFDFDDAIFCRSDGSASNLRQRRFHNITSQCDAVWAGNDFLAGKAKPDCTETHVIPTAIKLPRYQPKQHKNDAFIDCVWIGSSSTRRYLEQIIPLLDKLADKHPQLRLKVIADFSPKTKTIEVLTVAWSKAGEADALASAHIGIAPMIENDWTSGKCGLKVIQYMAAGLPVVTDNAGVNKLLVDHGCTGFVANHEQQWEQAMSSLINNPSLCTQMGQKGREKVERNYSLQTSFEKMLASLSKFKIDQ